MEKPTEPIESAPQYLCDYWDCHQFSYMHCEGCKPGDSLAYYCCREHQRACWPSHKPCCQENDVAIDGYALTALVYKVVEGLDGRLDSLCHRETRIVKRRAEDGDEFYGNNVQIVLQQPPDTPLLMRCSDAFCRNSAQLHPAVDVEAGDVELVVDDAQRERDATLCRMTYWALRCMSSGFTLNKVFINVLEALRRIGYKRICFGTAVTLSLVHEPRLELLHLAPRHRVTVEVDGVEQPSGAADGLLYYVVVLDRYAVDLAAGQHWVFDEERLYRPLAVMPRPLYNVVMGRLIDDTKKLKKDEMLRDRMARNEHIGPMTDLVLANLGLTAVAEEEKQESEAK
jgi:hypothetical protein